MHVDFDVAVHQTAVVKVSTWLLLPLLFSKKKIIKKQKKKILNLNSQKRSKTNIKKFCKSSCWLQDNNRGRGGEGRSTT